MPCTRRWTPRSAASPSGCPPTPCSSSSRSSAPPPTTASSRPPRSCPSCSSASTSAAPVPARSQPGRLEEETGGAVVPSSRESWDGYMRKRCKRPAPGLGQRVRGLIPEGLIDVERALAAPTRRSAVQSLPAARRGTARAPRSTGRCRPGIALTGPSMKAFALPTFGDARLRLNVRGRERDGIVEPADYETTCREVEDSIRACRDPRTGGPVVAKTWRPRAGAPMEAGGCDADIVLQWSHAFDALEHPEAGLIGPFPFRRTGAHTSGGFAFFSGPAHRAGRPRRVARHRPARDAGGAPRAGGAGGPPRPSDRGAACSRVAA